LQSEQVNELAGALSKAQGNFRPIKKDQIAEVNGQKGSYTYHYADLASVLDGIRAPLSACGLALLQRLTSDEAGLVLETALIHESGQWVGSQFPIVGPLDRPQVLGSVITYARRYSICALIGVAPEAEDDDGALAETAAKSRVRIEQPKTKTVPAPSPEYGRFITEWLAEVNREWRSIAESKYGLERPKDLLNGYHAANHLINKALDRGVLRGTSMKRLRRSDGRRDWRMASRFLSAWFDRNPDGVKQLLKEFGRVEIDKACAALEAEVSGTAGRGMT
jgi:hypothetical protein